MTINYGKRNPGGLTASSPGDTLYIPFATYNDSGASIGIGGTFAVSDIEIFKNGGATPRATDSGYSLISDTGQYGDRVGLHRFSISIFNTADDTGFFDVGSHYHIGVDSITVDGRTVRFIPAVFEIGTEQANVTQVDGDTGFADILGKFTSLLSTAGQIDTGTISGGFIPANVRQVAGDTGAAVHLAQMSDEYDTGRLPAEATATTDTGAVNNAVWNGVRADHTTAGSFGEYVLADVQYVDADTGAADLLGKAFATTPTYFQQVDVQQVDGDTGSATHVQQAFADVFDLPAAIWDETDTGHQNSGSYGTIRQLIGNIGASSGGALNFANEADNVDTAIKSVSFVGVETSGTNTSVNAEDGVYHQIDDSANAIDIVYQFDVGGGRTANSLTFKGYLSSSNDSINVQAYNGSTWDTRAAIEGQNGTANISREIPLLGTHTGTGSDIGKVFIRFVCSSQSNPTLFVDELLVQAVNIGQTVGYAEGAIWIDTNNGTAGTEAFVNGTADNPVDSWADALTLSSSTGIVKFKFKSPSSISLTANSDNYHLEGDNWTLALNGQSVDNIYISGAFISGISSGDNLRLDNCSIGTSTIGTTWATDCRITGTITLLSAGGYFFQGCFAPTDGTPIIDLGSAVGAQTVCLSPLFGGMEIRNSKAGDLVHVEGSGELTLAASCTAGTIEIAGDFYTTDNSAGASVRYDNNTDNVAQILADTDTGIQGGVHVISISDTGINNRLAVIAADTDTGIQPPTAAAIASAVWDDNDTGHGVNIRYVNATLITGTGDTGLGDTWRPA